MSLDVWGVALRGASIAVLPAIFTCRCCCYLFVAASITSLQGFARGEWAVLDDPFGP